MKMNGWTLDTPTPINKRPLHLSEMHVPSAAADELLFLMLAGSAERTRMLSKVNCQCAARLLAPLRAEITILCAH